MTPSKPRRNYHEKKALRCMQNIISMKKKLKKLEDVNFEKIENIKKEIVEIKRSTVTLRCIDCNNEFAISFKQFTSGEYPLYCHKCNHTSETHSDGKPIYPNNLWRVK